VQFHVVWEENASAIGSELTQNGHEGFGLVTNGCFKRCGIGASFIVLVRHFSYRAGGVCGVWMVFGEMVLFVSFRQEPRLP
jgi:hypothetical protein